MGKFSQFQQLGGFIISCAFVWQLWRLALALKSLDWKPVDATVVRVRLHTGLDGDGDETFRPEIVYRYSVAGRSYETNRISYRPLPASDLARAQEVVHGLKVHDHVTAYVDPKNSRRSVLVRGSDGWNLWHLLFTLFALLALLYFPSVG